MLVGQVVAAPPSAGPTDGSGTFSTVLGCNASGSGQNAVSVFGVYASAVGEGGSAFGFYSLAGKWASGFGLSSTATGIGSTALGFGARAISTNAVAIGGAGGNGVTALTVANSTTASGVGSIAIGSNTLRGAQAAGTDAIAIGGQSTASFSSGIAIGRGSTSAGAFGLAAGDGASASTNGIAIGKGTIATGTSSISIGLGNNVSGNNSGAIGDPSTVTGANSYSLGNNNSVASNNAFALGNNITIPTGLDGSVVLGNDSTVSASVPTAGATINGVTYNYAGATPVVGGVVSVGSAGGERQITNVAAGQVSSASTDAVNGSQLFATNTSVNSLGTTVNNIVNNGAGIKYFHSNSILADSLASGTDSVAVGPAATASASNAMALGNGATATIADSVALGSGATTTAAIANLGNTINGTAYTYAGGAPIGVLSVGSVGSERQITNVAAGQVSSTSTDAVNGSQLFATNTAVDVLGVSVNNIVNNGAGIKYFHSNSSLADSTATGIDSVAIGPQAVAVGAQSVALGTGAAANHDGSVALGSSAVTTVGAQSGYTAYGLSAAQNSVGEVGVGTALGDRKITGVAAGSALNDAVNVEQLTAVGNQVAQNTTNISNLDGRVTNLEGDILNVSGGITSVVNRVTQVESNVTNLQSGKDGMFQVNNTSAASKPSVTGTNAIAAGPGAVASGNNSAAIGTNAKASGTNSVAVGHDASATGNNSVALGANSVGTRDNSVSVGAVGSERQITNVAAATEGTDAVNFDQLNKSVANITNNTTAYTDQRFSELKRDLKKQDNTLSAGIAGAMAMASLPQPYSPGASMTSIAVANYRGQSALSFGISRISDNGRWVGKLQASTSTQGDTGVGLGIGYQW